MAKGKDSTSNSPIKSDKSEETMDTVDPKTRTKVHLGNIPSKIDEARLKAILSEFGPIKSLKIYPGKGDYPNWAVAHFEENKPAERCIRNYGLVSDAVGDLVKIRWYGTSRKQSPIKSGKECFDPGCQHNNDETAETCSKCGISLDIFKRPKLDAAKKADLFKELENSSALSPTKNPNAAMIVLKQKVLDMEATLKLTEQQLEKVQTKSGIDEDLERIIRLRAEMIDRKVPIKVVKKHDENDNLPEVVKCYGEIRADEGIETLIENVREAYDFYDVCARRLERGSKKKQIKPAIQQSQIQIVAGAAMALHLALMDYLDDFPIDKHRHILMLIHQALRYNPKKSSDDIFDVPELQKEMDEIVPKMESMVVEEPVDVHKTLRELSGSLTLLASIVTPEHNLVGFNGNLPPIEDLAKKAIKDCESVLKTHRESASAAPATFDQAYTLKILYSVKNHVENNLKKYKVRRTRHSWLTE